MAELPVQLTSFVGREAELAAAVDFARSSRLVTFTGPGGVGKTRLAVEVARRLDSEVEVVHFVELAPVSDPALLELAVVAAVDARQGPGQTPFATIVSVLSGPRTVLVLDNCEHLVDAVARLVDGILRRLPDIAVVVTSREPLGIGPEVVWNVPPLSDADAITLFVERAHHVDPGFDVERLPGGLVVDVCRRLDGLPLAIELAASRLRQMPIAEIHARLGSRFTLLANSDRLAVSRHRTLEAAIAWSYDLLAQDESAAFNALSVFAGGFDLDSAEAVASCDLAIIGRLVDRSMVVTTEGIAGRARYRLLETLRSFGAQRLEASGRSQAINERHFRYWRKFARHAAPQMRGPDQAYWFDRLDEELPNIRSALDWAREADPNGALDTAVELIWFWKVRGHWAEARSRFKELTTDPECLDPKLVAAALTEAADFAAQLGDTETAVSETEIALELYRTLDDPRGLARTLLSKAWNAARRRGETADLNAVIEQAVEAARHSADEHILAECLALRGWLRKERGRVDDGRADYEAAIEIDRRTGDLWTLALHEDMLGNLEYFLGRHERAQQLFDEFLKLLVEVGDRMLIRHAFTEVAKVKMALRDEAGARNWFQHALSAEEAGFPDAACLIGLAELAARSGRFERAFKLHGAATAMPFVRVRSRYTALEAQPWVATGRHELGREKAERAWLAGAAMSTSEAVAYALSDADEAVTGAGPLTIREQEIAAMVARGLRNRVIADELHLSKRTVDAHVEHIRNKLGFESRAQIARWVTEQGGVKK